MPNIHSERTMGRPPQTVSMGREGQQAALGIDRRMVWTLAITSALAVANLYYIQPLLADMGRSFAVSESAIGFVATFTQLGYAAGLLLIVPLVAVFDRRRLVMFTLLAVTV